MIDNYSAGKSLSSYQRVAEVINSHMNSGRLPKDTNAIYYLLSSQDVNEGAFCTKYCGYHSYFNTGPQNYLFSFVGNPARCPNNCLFLNKIVSPTNDIGVDGAVNIMARELVETMTNPYFNGWFDWIGYENGEKW